MAQTPPRGLVRPLVRGLQGYVPGEQPRGQELIKLNTNENPYPPSEKVLAATRDAVDGRLRLYPDPTAAALRARLAQVHSCCSDAILVGNGSDELLAVLIRAVVEPAASVSERRRHAATVQYFAPGYSLYRVLAEAHGAIAAPVALAPDFALPAGGALRRAGFSTRAPITFLTTPNAPSGRAYPVAQLEELCAVSRGVVVLDEAYIDFGGQPATELPLRYPNAVVARTFSKGYSLCFQRVGYLIGHPELLGELAKLRDSYSVNGLGQVAALASLSDRPYY
ncbi:MAG: pyridoxal phosphate-dependent aminotransferase, partial [Gaiellales bacterium]